ncbi:hypothetical protein CEXT_807361 [Caerostris extrusa]|uniref:Uncharacterized protein n=1 Tax=Caerostris extrusa TaxID=172846 RepID=A0AAV4UXU5_CAEEX|nr:hypothetical protein CEXT_807361 [Caerostris extrusa]
MGLMEDAGLYNCILVSVSSSIWISVGGNLPPHPKIHPKQSKKFNKEKPGEAGLTALPFFYGFTVFVNVISIVLDGSPGKF